MTTSTALTVGDLMALEPVVIQANASLDEAAKLLDHHGITGVPVVDRSGTLVGVLSQTDLVRARSTEYLWANWPGLAVRHLMTAPAITVHRSTSIPVAARKMERHHIHRLVVVADDDATLPIGILSTTDLVHAIATGARDVRSPPASAPSKRAPGPHRVQNSVPWAPAARRRDRIQETRAARSPSPHGPNRECRRSRSSRAPGQWSGSPTHAA